MGADIHYILERQDKEGNWHTTFTQEYSYQYYEENNISGREKYNSPQEEVSDRNYYLFAQLSSVRGDGPNIATSGLPNDIAYHSKEIIDSWGDDAHSIGYLYGNQIFNLLNDENWPKDLNYWPKVVIETIKKFSEILPTAQKDSHNEYYYKSEPHHELDRKIKNKELPDIETNPQSWRIIIYYDN